MTEKEWQWVKINGMTYLHDPNTSALYDNINLFPSGYLYPDRTRDFTKQPPPLVSTMNDPEIKAYMKNPTKAPKEGMDWAAYWQKRREKEAAEGKVQGWKAPAKAKPPAKAKGIAAITKQMTTIHL